MLSPDLLPASKISRTPSENRILPLGDHGLTLMASPYTQHTTYIYRSVFKCEPLFGCEREDSPERDTWQSDFCGLSFIQSA
ncbi:hypothetical protein OSB04_025922 [Centaurea solstitialis]|uniref:Uncharacterized protein n=1 Tax=Centaurea solstitialis TaxID=347529 RepID=A0AA38WBQ7_9ASTR|nr:hypothetical protein OSB04_025922 [Centaurea solstitialis]